MRLVYLLNMLRHYYYYHNVLNHSKAEGEVRPVQPVKAPSKFILLTVLRQYF